MGASAFGALDMTSSVFEWCADYYQEDYYYVSPEFDPQGPAMGTERSFRDVHGWLYSVTSNGRATARAHNSVLNSNDVLGFRCVQDPP
jgi:formylglycine-generating enzyme required for sulfatase activity